MRVHVSGLSVADAGLFLDDHLTDLTRQVIRGNGEPDIAIGPAARLCGMLELASWMAGLNFPVLGLMRPMLPT